MSLGRFAQIEEGRSYEPTIKSIPLAIGEGANLPIYFRITTLSV